MKATTFAVEFWQSEVHINICKIRNTIENRIVVKNDFEMTVSFCTDTIFYSFFRCLRMESRFSISIILALISLHLVSSQPTGNDRKCQRNVLKLIHCLVAAIQQLKSLNPQSQLVSLPVRISYSFL